MGFLIFLILLNAVATILSGIRFFTDLVQSSLTEDSWFNLCLCIFNFILFVINVIRLKYYDD